MFWFLLVVAKQKSIEYSTSSLYLFVWSECDAIDYHSESSFSSRQFVWMWIQLLCFTRIPNPLGISLTISAISPFQIEEQQEFHNSPKSIPTVCSDCLWYWQLNFRKRQFCFQIAKIILWPLPKRGNAFLLKINEKCLPVQILSRYLRNFGLKIVILDYHRSRMKAHWCVHLGLKHRDATRVLIICNILKLEKIKWWPVWFKNNSDTIGRFVQEILKDFEKFHCVSHLKRICYFQGDRVQNTPDAYLLTATFPDSVPLKDTAPLWMHPKVRAPKFFRALFVYNNIYTQNGLKF